MAWSSLKQVSPSPQKFIKEEPMNPMNLSLIAAPATAMTIVKTALLSGALVASAQWIVLAQPMEKKGTTCRF